MGKLLTYNRLIIFVVLVIFLLMGIQNSFCLTDIDYSLRKLKYSEGRLSAEESFHGGNSAKLSVYEKTKYARVYIDMDEPMPLQDLNSSACGFAPNPEADRYS